MMKKLCVFAALVMAAGNALYAQSGFSFATRLATDFSGASPAIGFEINLSGIDILADVTGSYYTETRSDENYMTFDTNNATEGLAVTAYLGIAPKARLSNKVTLTFPILLDAYYGAEAVSYNDPETFQQNGVKDAGVMGAGVNLGARTYLALSPRCDVFAGVLFYAFDLRNTKVVYWGASPSDTYTFDYLSQNYLKGGEFQIGVRFKTGDAAPEAPGTLEQLKPKRETPKSPQADDEGDEELLDEDFS